MNWIESLYPQERERVFEAMRRIGERVEVSFIAMRKLGAPAGTIPVGAAAFDEFLSGEGPAVFLRALRNGEAPEDAEIQAKEWARGAIKIHNAKRPTQFDWARDEIAGDGPIERARRDIERQFGAKYGEQYWQERDTSQGRQGEQDTARPGTAA